MKTLALSAALFAFGATIANAQPLSPPDGTYVYTMYDSGAPAFTSTIVVKSSGSTFTVTETTKLPDGPVAKTQSTWSRSTLLPMTFAVYQGQIALHARITPSGLTFMQRRRTTISRLTGTSYILPSVGLIADGIMMLGYAVAAHPGQSLTLEEIQNSGQTVRIRPNRAMPHGGPVGDVAVTVTKNKRQGNDADLEQIIVWLNPKTGVMDFSTATPGTARIKLVKFTPASAPASP